MFYYKGLVYIYMTVPIATINQNTSASGHSNLQFRHCTNPRSVLHCIFRGSRRSLACRRAWISWFIQLCMEDEGQNLSESWRNKGIWVEITETQTCTHTQATYTLHTYILLQVSYNETLQKGSKQNKTLDVRASVRLSNSLLRLVQRS